MNNIRVDDTVMLVRGLSSYFKKGDFFEVGKISEKGYRLQRSNKHYRGGYEVRTITVPREYIRKLYEE